MLWVKPFKIPPQQQHIGLECGKGLLVSGMSDVLLWIIFAAMTGVAVLALLGALSRPERVEDAAAKDVEVYKDQLREIDQDLERGMIGAQDAEAARIEVSRRLLAARPSACALNPSAARVQRQLAAVAVVVGLPAIGLGGYAALGSPHLAAGPGRAEQAVESLDMQSLPAMVAQVENHLKGQPGDGKAWEVLAPIYLRDGRHREAVEAYANALRLLGSTAKREADFGEAHLVLSQGVVREEARAAFARALALDPQHVKARYYRGLGAEQAGDRESALKEWRAILHEGAASSLSTFLQGEIARVSGVSSPAGPTRDDIAAAAALSMDQRAAMIQGMVDGLAERLKQDGSDRDGWLKLIRAYVVMGETEKAKAALKDAQAALSSRPEDVRAVNDLARSLALAGAP